MMTNLDSKPHSNSHQTLGNVTVSHGLTPPKTLTRPALASDIEPATDTLAALYKACGDALRIEILRVLQNDSFGVLELCTLFDVKQSGMSHHLKVLSNAGLVEAQREGNSLFYRRPVFRSDQDNSMAIQSIFDAIDKISASAGLTERIQEIRSARASLSQAFFARNADRFSEQQELIASYEQYAEPARDLLFAEEFGPDATVMEIGPGEGLFLKDLAPAFKTVYALDNAAGMLDKAQELVKKHRLKNVHCMLGDSATALASNIKVDAIVMNMVLHHIARPLDIFADAAKLLKANGILVISDLSHHDQSWVRDNCGDIWLGFESQELSRWAMQYGLQELDSLYIGLRNGFQIQVRKFINAGESNKF
jgi:ArsR family transcriptional regulator